MPSRWQISYSRRNREHLRSFRKHKPISNAASYTEMNLLKNIRVVLIKKLNHYQIKISDRTHYPGWIHVRIHLSFVFPPSYRLMFWDRLALSDTSRVMRPMPKYTTVCTVLRDSSCCLKRSGNFIHRWDIHAH